MAKTATAVGELTERITIQSRTPAAVSVSSTAPPPVAPQAGGSTIPRIRRTPRPPA